MIQCDANKLPEEVKEKAHEYVEKRKPRFKTFGVTQEDVKCAWLNGFAFCLEGTVEVKVKQCATCVYTDSPCTPLDYEKDKEGVCNHYKSIFEEYAKLKGDSESILDNWCRGEDPCLHLKKRDDQLTKAKEIIRYLCEMARELSKPNPQPFNVEYSLREADQFLKENE